MMYSYTRKNKHLKKYVLGSMFVVCLAAVLGVSYLVMNQGEEETASVGTTDIDVPVIALPKTTEKAIRPYTVDANIVLDYYDGNDSEVDNMTKFEGVYRANQGIDYAKDGEAFDVLAIYSGEVSDIKEDPLFGHSVTITSGDVKITYQSLQDMTKSVGDKVAQGDSLSLASSNIYNKDLGNHLHVVVEKNGVRMDPENLYGCSIEELK